MSPVESFVGAIVGGALLCGACSPSGGSDEGSNGGAPPVAASGGGPATGGAGSLATGSGGEPVISDPGSLNTSGRSDETCATAAYRTDLLPSNLLFVVDRSGL
jgi:hypothetical protein